MKIENLSNENLFLAKINKNSNKVNNDFKALLEETKKKHEVSYTINVQSIGSEENKNIEPDLKLRLEVISLGNKLLDKIEIYQKALENDKIPFSKLESLSSSLKEEIDGIKNLSEKLSKADPLRKILKEIEIIGIVEVLKCKQHRYI